MFVRVLASVEIDPENLESIMKLDYPTGSGLGSDIGHAMDAVLFKEPGARYLKGDRARLPESMEAWVFVLVDRPADSHLPMGASFYGLPLGSVELEEC